MRYLAIAFSLALAYCQVPAYAQRAGYIPWAAGNVPNGVPLLDNNGNATTGIAPPGAAIDTAPQLFADFTAHSYYHSILNASTATEQRGAVWANSAFGSYIDPASNGQWSIYGPRLTFDPTINEEIGLQIEPATNNIFTGSTGFTSNGCTFNSGADNQATVQASAATLFNGYAALQILRDSSANNAVPNIVCNLSAPSNYTAAIWYMVPGTTYTGAPPSATFPSTATGICVIVQGTDITGYKVCPNPNIRDTWVRVLVPIAATTGATQFQAVLQVQGPPGSLVISTGWQVEAGTSPTSLTNSTNARTAESATSTTIDSTNGGTIIYSVDPEYLPNTAVSDGGINLTSRAPSNIAASDEISIALIGDAVSPFPQVTAKVSGTPVATIHGGALFANQPATIGLSFGPNGYIYTDNIGGFATASGAFSTNLKSIQIIPSTNATRKLAYYPKPMTAAQLAVAVGSGAIVSASADTAHPGKTTSAKFVGLSVETHAWAGAAMFSNRFAGSLSRIMALLGGGSFRIGGDSSEMSGFYPAQSDIAPIGPFFAALPNWDLYFGMNYCANNPAEAATEAGFLFAAMPSAFIQYGNEPDIYTSTGCVPLAPATNQWAPSNYIAQWNTYQSSVIAAAPGVLVTGPDIGSYDAWLNPFLVAEGSTIKKTTRHYYGLCPPSSLVTPASLLASDAPYAEQIFSNEVSLAAKSNLSMHMTEDNSVCGGGQTGVSDVPMSEAWGVEHMLQLMRAGFDGVNFHGDTFTTNGIYTAIIANTVDSSWNFRPLGYAMLLISKVQGMTLLPTTGSVPFTTAPVQGFVDSSGSVWFVAVNKNLTQNETLTIDQSGTWSNQQYMILTYAPGASPTTPQPATPTSMIFGGASVNDDSSWSPTWSNAPRGTPLTIPPASSILIKLM